MESSATEVDESGELVASAEPDKRLFIEMLTRDIELIPAILDLWDNSIDGAMRSLKKSNKKAKPTTTGKPLHGHTVTIRINANEFTITDNSGGIPLDVAVNYAFRFGRAKNAPSIDGAVGSFGVGMKRALFKIGRAFAVNSKSGAGSFEMDIDVDTWADVTGVWHFPFKVADPSYIGNGPDQTGTTVRIYKLIPSIAAQFADALFVQRLRHELEIRRPEAYDLGIKTVFNGDSLKPHVAVLARSKNLVPAVENITLDSGVDIHIRAGIVKGRSDDDLDDGDGTKFIGTDTAGWYVIANGRVLLAAERTRITGWGDDIASYHPQYRNFRGYVELRAADGRLLPWNTTKTGVDEDSDVWKVIYGHMKTVLADVQALINRLKLERTVERETGYRGPILTELASAVATPLDNLPKKKTPLQYPREDDNKPSVPPRQLISFRVDQTKYARAVEATGVASAAELGRALFEYYWSAEIAD
jgi:hypothetical protein